MPTMLRGLTPRRALSVGDEPLLMEQVSHALVTQSRFQHLNRSRVAKMSCDLTAQSIEEMRPRKRRSANLRLSTTCCGYLGRSVQMVPWEVGALRYPSPLHNNGLPLRTTGCHCVQHAHIGWSLGGTVQQLHVGMGQYVSSLGQEGVAQGLWVVVQVVRCLHQAQTLKVTGPSPGSVLSDTLHSLGRCFAPAAPIGALNMTQPKQRQ